MRRRNIIAGLTGITAYPFAGRAQQPGKVHTILWVSTEAQPDPFIQGFREGMRELGYVEGRNLSFVLRFSPGDPAAVDAMLPELMQIPADLIISSGPAIRGMRKATGRPVLFAISGDPVELGLAESLSRPGRNFTGSTFMSLDLAQKRVHLLRDLLPGMRSLAILADATHPGEQAERAATRQAAESLALTVAYVPFRSAEDLDGALDRLRETRSNAMLTFPDGVTLVHRAKITRFAKANRLPSMFGWREYCEAGGLASYGANQRRTYFRLAAYADRLLRGEKPGELPIEQPTHFELVINAATARDLAIPIPPVIMARADEVLD